MEIPQQPILSPEVCIICFANANRSCNICQNAFYCSREHQLQDLPVHKETCNKDPFQCVVNEINFPSFLQDEWCQNNLPAAEPEELSLLQAVSEFGTAPSTVEKSTDYPPLTEDDLFSSFPSEFLSSENNLWEIIKNCEGAQDLFDGGNFLDKEPELLSIPEPSQSNLISLSEQFNQPDQSNQILQPGQSNQILQSGQSNQLLQPGQSNQLLQSGQSNQILQSGQSNQLLQSGQSNQILQSEQSKQILQSRQSNQILQSGQSNQVYQSRPSNQVLQSGQSNQIPQPGQSNQTPQPDQSNQILGKKVLNLMGGASLQSICSNIVGDLNKYGICVLDNFLGDALGNLILGEVKNLYGKGIFKKGELVVPNPFLAKENVRSDVTMWVNGTEPECAYIGHLMQVLDILITTCNKFQESGTLSKYKLHRRTKAMIACYPGDGTHYKKHIDNPHKDGRCVTCIYYLNKNWNTETDGGMLRMFPSVMEDDIAQIEPIFDRMIFFWSDKRNPHEVLKAFRTRFAITVWYFDADERDRALLKARIRAQGSRQSMNLAGK